MSKFSPKAEVTKVEITEYIKNVEVLFKNKYQFVEALDESIRELSAYAQDNKRELIFLNSVKRRVKVYC